MRPFRIVKDRGLRWLCKTGRPDFYLPDETTVSRDVKRLYHYSHEKLAAELQVSTFLVTELRLMRTYQDYEGFLVFQLDCWTAPNHHAWMSIRALNELTHKSTSHS